MKLRCIHTNLTKSCPLIIVGMEYTATHVLTYLEMLRELASRGLTIIIPPPFDEGVWYELEETGKGHWYHESHFCELLTLSISKAEIKGTELQTVEC